MFILSTSIFSSITSIFISIIIIILIDAWSDHQLTNSIPVETSPVGPPESGAVAGPHWAWSPQPATCAVYRWPTLMSWFVIRVSRWLPFRFLANQAGQWGKLKTS